jgi:hypothetical protein
MTKRLALALIVAVISGSYAWMHAGVLAAARQRVVVNIAARGLFWVLALAASGCESAGQKYVRLSEEQLTTCLLAESDSSDIAHGSNATSAQQFEAARVDCILARRNLARFMSER